MLYRSITGKEAGVKILLTGGGTGGHITPLLAVARDLKKIDPNIIVEYVGERGSKFDHITNGNQDFDEIIRIYAGKFRRYHGESWLKRLTDFKTLFFNFRDLVLLIAGIFQAIILINRQKPDVIFLKGGFVGVPVGLAAAILRVPFVTHDSDAVPGLANQLVGRWARIHLVALPVSEYNYSPKNTIQVGVIVADEFKYVDSQTQAVFKQALNLDSKNPLLVITGGSGGAQRLNEAMIKIVPKLLSDFKELQIIHQVGQGKSNVYGKYSNHRLQVVDFMKPMHQFTGAADMVVARSGANALAELGTQGKAVIVVANPLLTGGHQLKNAEKLVDINAVISVHETAQKTDELQLNAAIRDLLKSPLNRQKIAANLHESTLRGASGKIADILIGLVSGKTKK